MPRPDGGPQVRHLHHSGRAGAAGGRIFAGGLRKTRHAGGKAGTAVEKAAAKRWEDRTPPTPMIRWLRDKQPKAGGDPATASTGKPAGNGSTTSTAPPSFGGPSGTTGSATPAPATTPRGGAPRCTATTAPHRWGDGSTSTVSRFAINLEAPTSDAEFLASCIDLGDALRGMAEEIGEWAEGIASLGLPSSVTTPLNAVAEGITEAAAGAARAASSFADEFEDAREVAARGMKFTGRDAA